MLRSLSTVLLLAGIISLSTYNALSQTRRSTGVNNQKSTGSSQLTGGSVVLYPAVIRLGKGETRTVTAAAYDDAGNPVFDAEFDSFVGLDCEVDTDRLLAEHGIF